MSVYKQTVISDFSDAAFLENFRIDSDGSLKKREGARLVVNFGERVRGAVSDMNCSYVVAGASLWRLTGDVSECLGMMWDAEFYENERCALVLWRDSLLVIGGGAFYCFNKTSGTFESVPGYAPVMLRGVTGATESEGEPWEEANTLSSRASTLINPTSSLRDYFLWGTPTEIHRVTADGASVPTSAYRLYAYPDISYIEFTDRSYLAASEIRVEYSCYELEGTDRRSELLHNVNAAVYEGEDADRLFIFGGALGATVLYSEVSHASADSESSTVDYFPERCRFTVGNGRERVTSVNSIDGRAVIVTEGAIYEPVTTPSRTENGIGIKSFSARCLLYNYGTSASAGSVAADGKLFILSERGLFEVRYDKFFNDYRTKRLDLLSGGAARSDMKLYLNLKASELWYHSGRRAYIVNTETGERYSFDVPEAERMFTHAGYAAFISGTCAYVFDPSVGLDGGVGFESVYVSRPIAPEGFFTEKTVRDFGVALDVGSRVEVRLTSDKGITFENTLSSENGTGVSPAALCCHAHLGNASHVTVRLTCPADTVGGHIRAVMLGYGKKGDSK